MRTVENKAYGSSSYTGELDVMGRAHGKGKMTYKNGKVYDGEWRNGNRHGVGKMVYYYSGSFYEGDWVDGLKHGKGKMVYYSGAFKL